MNKQLTFSLTSLCFIATSAISQAAIIADFEGPSDSYSEASLRGEAFVKPGIRSGGPTGNYYHLLDGAQGNSGHYLSFSSDGSSAGWTTASFSMDYRASRVAADGFSVGFLDVGTHGASGAIKAGTTGLGDTEERGAYSNSIGVGFRTFNGTNATVNYNGAESADTGYNLSTDAWGSLEVVMNRSSVGGDISLDATMYTETGLGGTASTVFDDYTISGASLDEFRVQLAGRTGGAAMDLDVDNLNLTVSTIPEPSSTALFALASLGLLIRKRR